MAGRIIPAILSGGSGSRLWPMSRELHPKQLLELCSDKSMLQETALRVADGDRFAAPIIVCNEEHRFVIAEQMRQSGVKPLAIILEPAARNTAAAVAVAALTAAETDPAAKLLVLPADHLIRDKKAFAAAVAAAEQAADRGRLCTFGISPTRAETGYGYIRAGAAADGAPGARDVVAFVEKPDSATAEEYVRSGDYLWNSGMFLFPVVELLAEFERLAPAVLDAVRRAVSDKARDLDFLRLDKTAFESAPSISIDYAVMEKTDRAAVVPCDLGWTDVGAWSALWEVGAQDADGNVEIGDVVTVGVRDSYVRSDHMLTAVIGLTDVVVVTTDDAVLVSSRDAAQDVKKVVEQLKAAGRREPVSHRKVHRPWGSFQSLHSGERFQVKMLTITPGARLSLQRHHHRAEHWVVVNGTALVTRGTEQFNVYENQSIYIPIGEAHRLENPGKVPLNIIEVQSGSYLGEDDIVRLDDAYGRAPAQV
jgi:mannose-1-phosphate guanylyltransferase / mannose-6-phosphate isomerase